MTAKLTPVEVVAWLRKQSQAYSDAADLIEAASFPAETGRSDLRPIKLDSRLSPDGSHKVVFPVPQLSLKAIRDRLSKKSARAGDLASHFAVDEKEIWALVQSEGSGIRMAERGWLKVDSTPSEPKQNIFAAAK